MGSPDPATAGRPPRTRPAARPGPADLAAANGRTIPDVTGPGLRVLFAGINPGLYSAATGHHFARPGNRFWPALHASGFTSRLLHPWEQDLLPPLGLGITNVVARSSATAAELSAAEITAGSHALLAKIEAWQPAWVAVLGVTVYRTAFAQPRAQAGPQPPLAGAQAWLLPNPSGLNAHWPPATLAAEFARLREAAARPACPS